jgi:glycerol-3-phosphate acyltransferase PlsY
MQIVLLIIGSYFLGAIPFGLLIAKAHGIDLRKIGSGNIGATNVSRALGKKWAYICFILDVAKGLLPMLAAAIILPPQKTSSDLLLWLAVGIAAIVGHVLPIYLKFRGGKGVATSLGVVLGLWPYFTIPGLIIFAVWALCVVIWHYISLASIIGAILFPIAVCVGIVIADDWHFTTLWPLVVVSSLLCIVIVARHRDNIKRIIAGTESKVAMFAK